MRISFSDDEDEELAQPVDYSHILQTTPSTSQKAPVTEPVDETFAFLLQARQRNRDDILMNMASPPKVADPFSLLSQENSTPPTKSSLREWLDNAENAPITTTPVYSCKTPKSRTPLSVLMHRERRLNEIRNEENPDPDFEPVSYRQMRRQIQKKLEAKEGLEDCLSTTPSREFRRRQEAFVIDDGDEEDDLPLSDIKSKLRIHNRKIDESSNGTEGNDKKSEDNDVTVAAESTKSSQLQTTEAQSNPSSNAEAELLEEQQQKVEVVDNSIPLEDLDLIDELPPTQDEDDLPLSELLRRQSYKKKEGNTSCTSSIVVRSDASSEKLKEEIEEKNPSCSSSSSKSYSRPSSVIIINDETSDTKKWSNEKETKSAQNNTTSTIVLDDDDLPLSKVRENLRKRHGTESSTWSQVMTDVDLFDDEGEDTENDNVALVSQSSACTPKRVNPSSSSSTENTVKASPASSLLTARNTPLREKRSAQKSPFVETPKTTRTLRKRKLELRYYSSDEEEQRLYGTKRNENQSLTPSRQGSAKRSRNAPNTPSESTTPKRSVSSRTPTSRTANVVHFFDSNVDINEDD
ncbi:unnamed protein product, partial [Mesorhabditis belari]|uniref:Uncharacterized protein n=1 Tax=Mesorhabditis belari TaxID=2138241 RepID=A0AAF3F3X4_9BILA